MEHDHGSIWSEYLDLLTDPAHLMLEATLILVVDVVIGLLLWPLIRKAWNARIEHEHKRIDREHGVVHSDHVSPVPPARSDRIG